MGRPRAEEEKKKKIRIVGYVSEEEMAEVQAFLERERFTIGALVARAVLAHVRGKKPWFKIFWEARWKKRN